ncbi:MAG: hypothetical protein AB2L20_27895 [Mangrovibacterium sp.]
MINIYLKWEKIKSIVVFCLILMIALFFEAQDYNSPGKKEDASLYFIRLKSYKNIFDVGHRLKMINIQRKTIDTIMLKMNGVNNGVKKVDN